MSFEREAEEERRRAEAGIVMLRVGLALLDDARRGGGFEVDEARLASRVEEILGALRAAGTNPRGAIVEATPRDAERIQLSTATGESSSDDAVLRTDGVLVEQYSTIGMSAEIEIAGAEEPSPEQEEQMRLAMARFEAKAMRPHFEGRRFLRALPCDPLPGAEVQVLAAELFDDGLVVRYTFDRKPQPPELPEDGDPFFDGFSGDTEVRIEDDLGTDYFGGDGGGGGHEVIHCAASFSPAVPDGARLLRITTRSGTVELPLRG